MTNNTKFNGHKNLIDLIDAFNQKPTNPVQKHIEYLATAPDNYYMTSYDAALALHQIAAKCTDKELALQALDAAVEVLRATPVYAHELVNASEEI